MRLCGTYVNMYRQNGDLTNLLKLARKKCPECLFQWNCYLGNAQITVRQLFWCFPKFVYSGETEADDDLGALLSAADEYEINSMVNQINHASLKTFLKITFPVGFLQWRTEMRRMCHWFETSHCSRCVDVGTSSQNEVFEKGDGTL